MDENPDVANTALELDPDAAIERWCDPVLVEKLHRLREAGHDGMTFGAILGTERPEDRLEDPFCRVLDKLREQLHHKLCDGLLIGSGYVSGDPPGSPRSDVQPNRWSVLKLDFDNWSAEGTGITLNDLRIREPGPAPELLLSSPSDPPAETAEANDRKVISADEFVRQRLTLDTANLAAELDGRVFKLPSRPFQLLRLLAQRLHEGSPIVSAAEIHKAMFSEQTSHSRARGLVGELRPYLRATPASPDLIETRSNVGYALALEASEVSIKTKET